MEGNLQWDFKNCSHVGKVRHMEVRLEGCFCFWKGLTVNSDGASKFVRIMESSK